MSTTASSETRPPVPAGKRSRAARLIEQILRAGTPADELAAAIVVPPSILEAFRLGRMPIPLDRQLCLALLAIERVPTARRAGFVLRSQVGAEIALGGDMTELHNEPPVSRRWP